MRLEPPATLRYYVGLDLGQRRDYTALVVLEHSFKSFWGDQWLYARQGQNGTTKRTVRMIERIRLGTPYPEIVEWVQDIVSHVQFQNRTVLTVDATGVGAPVVDLLRRADMKVANLVPITITGGGRYIPGQSSVPRAELLTNLQIMIQNDEIDIATGCNQADALRRELNHLLLDGRGANGGHHDDISIALALAAWSARRGH
jgi:hypothetical protein